MRDQQAVFDVLAEDIETDLGGVKFDGGDEKQRSCVIHNAHCREGGEIRAQRFDQSKIFEQAQRAVEKRNRAGIDPGVGTADQPHAPAALRQSDGGSQAGGPGPDNDNVAGWFFDHAEGFRPPRTIWRGAGHERVVARPGL